MTVHSLPVTVISGFTRAGKTALLEYLLANAGTRRIAVIHEESSDMQGDIARLAKEGHIDAIVIESPVCAEPMVMAESLMPEEDEGPSPNLPITLDTMVTVVDATRFLDELASAEGLAERGLVPEEDDRTVGELSIEQIEFCDVLVIDQAQAVEEAALVRLRKVLASINPRAVQLIAQSGQVPIEALIGTGRFDFEATASAAGCLSALESHPAPAAELDANRRSGKTSPDASEGAVPFVYRARRPFHPARLFALLHEEWTGVLRSKGLFWIATRNDMAGTLSQVGGTCRHGPAGFWWAAQPAEEWPDDEALRAEITRDWLASPDAQGHETIGDRRQEFVMIGMNLDHDAWQRKLDACLLDEAEFALGEPGWHQFDDPFPQWDDDHEHGDEEGHSHGHDHR
jgi:G3E family GTPase